MSFVVPNHQYEVMVYKHKDEMSNEHAVTLNGVRVAFALKGKTSVVPGWAIDLLQDAVVRDMRVTVDESTGLDRIEGEIKTPRFSVQILRDITAQSPAPKPVPGGQIITAEAPNEGVPLDRDDLEAKTVKELADIARDKGVSSRNMSKADLVDALVGK